MMTRSGIFIKSYTRNNTSRNYENQTKISEGDSMHVNVVE